MSKSHVFEAVIVLAFIVLAATMFYMIESAGPYSHRQGPIYAGDSTVMLVGSDDTLYLVNWDVTSVRTDGSVAWRTELPPGWDKLKAVELRYSHGPDAPDTLYVGAMTAADEHAGNVYLYMFHSNLAYNLSDALPITADVESKIVAVGRDGIEWEYPFVTNGTRYHWGTFDNAYRPQDKIVVKASGNRIYVFHDHKEDVLGSNGKLLFSIGDVAEPAAVDEAGHVYVVHAARLTQQVNGSFMYPDPHVLDTLENDPQYYGEDFQRLAYDPTYMARTNTIEAYSPAGILLWSADVNEKIVGAYDDLSGSEPVLRSLPLYVNGSLYLPVANGTAVLDTGGRLKWVRHLYGPDTFEPFAALPVDESGNAYEAAVNDSSGVTHVYRITPAGNAAETWSYPRASYPWPAASPDGVAHMFLDSTPVSLTDREFSEAVDEFAPDTLVAYDIRHNETLWTFTVPREDIVTVTLNASNIADIWPAIPTAIMEMNKVLGMFAGWPADSIPLSPSRNDQIIVSEGKSLVYVSYYNRISEDPVVFNRSRCAYVNEIYALDGNGSLAWKIPVDGRVVKMAPGNNTVYYDIFNRGIGGKTAGTVAAGVALSAIAYVFIKFFAFGTVARARTRLDSNENRNRVLRYIVDHPGVTAVDIVREADMNMGTIRYHLLILALNHKIVTHRDNSKFLRYFKNSGAYTAAEKDLLSLMRRKPMLKILNVLLEKQRLSGPDIAKELNISNTAVNRHVAELYEKGIVEKHPAIEKGYEYTIKAERYQSVKDFLNRV
jgi:predicted transcriptional regulator